MEGELRGKSSGLLLTAVEVATSSVLHAFCTLNDGMLAVEGQVIKAQGPPLSAAEEAARQTLHSFMHQHPAFLMHVLHTYCSQRRAVELLLLPETFRDRIADMLASVWLFSKPPYTVYHL
jgi:hypothetical protein